MAKKKTSKKSDKKTTKKSTVKKKSKSEIVEIESSILKWLITHFKNAKIQYIVLIFSKNTIYAAGMEQSKVTMTLITIKDIEVKDAIMVFSIDGKLDSVLKNIAKKITISSKDKGRKAVIKSGSSKTIISLLDPDEYKEIIEYCEDPIIEKSTNNCRFRVKYDGDFGFNKLISIAKSGANNVEDITFELDSTPRLVGTVMYKDGDTTEVEVDIEDVEEEGTIESTTISPKYVKSFDIFQSDFSLTLNNSEDGEETNPTVSEMITEVGNEGYTAEIILMISPLKDDDEESMIVSEDKYSNDEDQDFGEEPSENDEDIEIEEDINF